MVRNVDVVWLSREMVQMSRVWNKSSIEQKYSLVCFM